MKYQPNGIHQLLPEIMSDAVTATFRRLLQTEIDLLKKAPVWLWQFEFSMHVWPLLERESRECTDQGSQHLLEMIYSSQDVEQAVSDIEGYLEAPQEPAPW